MRPEEARTVYRGPFLQVSLERWAGREREIVERPDVVAIVAVDRDGFLTLVRQHRPAARGELLEIPAGRVEAGEDPLATARRELLEETGLSGGVWRRGPTFWTTPGFCRERVHLFFAEELEPGERPAADDTDEVEVDRWPLAACETRLAELEDAKTLIGLLLYLEARR